MFEKKLTLTLNDGIGCAKVVNDVFQILGFVMSQIMRGKKKYLKITLLEVRGRERDIN